MIKQYLDSYARWDDRQITFGNDCLEIGVSIADNHPITEYILDKTTGRRWEAEDGRRLIQPTLTVRAACAKSEIIVSESDYDGRMKSHLQIEWILTDGDGMWKTVWQVFPGVPVIRKSLFAAGPYQTNEKTGCGDSGVWYADDLASEAVSFDRATFVIDSVSLHDHSDSSDDLVRTARNYPYFDEFYQRYPGHFFFLQDRQSACLTLCKLAPCTESEINTPPYGLRTTHQGSAEIIGLGIDLSQPLPAGEVVELYGSAIGVGKNRTECEKALRLFGRACLANPDRLTAVSNNWGGGNKDRMLSDAFVRREIEIGSEMLLDCVQIDDGWQNNDFPIPQYMRHRWSHMFEEGLDFWAPQPERFPNGLEPLAKYAMEKGTTLGIWVMDDPHESHRDFEKTGDMILSYYRQGIRQCKLDGVQLMAPIDTCRLRKMLDRLYQESRGELIFHTDITTGKRPGCLYMPQAGLIFFENRYVQQPGSFFAHRTLGNLWRLGHYIPTQRMVMEVPNPRQTSEGYLKDAFPPTRFPITTLFLAIAVSNPLIWADLQMLDPDDCAALCRLMAVWKPYAKALFDSDVRPIGDDPEDYTVTGFHAAGETEGHLFITNYEGMTAKIPVADLPDGVQLETLWADTGFTAEVRDGILHFTADTSCRAVWLKYMR